MREDNRGFTLLEITCVITIAFILLAAVAPNLKGYIHTAKKTRVNADAKSIYTATMATDFVDAVKLENIAGDTVEIDGVEYIYKYKLNLEDLDNAKILEKLTGVENIDTSRVYVIFE